MKYSLWCSWTLFLISTNTCAVCLPTWRICERVVISKDPSDTKFSRRFLFFHVFLWTNQKVSNDKCCLFHVLHPCVKFQICRPSYKKDWFWSKTIPLNTIRGQQRGLRSFKMHIGYEALQPLWDARCFEAAQKL